jgi:DNA-binding FadR family transcriptional regulator
MAEQPFTDPGVGSPHYVQIVEDLIGRIDAGALRPGDRLPPERDLSRQFGVNRMTLRQALGELKMRGLIAQRQATPGQEGYLEHRSVPRRTIGTRPHP